MAALVHLGWKNSKQAQQHTIIISLVEITSLAKFALRPYNYVHSFAEPTRLASAAVVDHARSQSKAEYVSSAWL